MNKNRIEKGTGRERILNAATELFLENGFESTSPQAIYAKSGVGQGSFYYHFKSKMVLMDHVLLGIRKTVEDEIQQLESKYSAPAERIKHYLVQRKRGRLGCRLGRFVYESSASDDALAKHMTAYLSMIKDFLQQNVQQAQDAGEIVKQLSASSIADCIVTQIQGAYLLARMQQDDAIVQKSLNELTELIFIG